MRDDAAAGLPGPLQRLLLKAEAEAFFHHEADLLDARRFSEWLGLLTEDVKVWMPIAQNVATDDLSSEYTVEDDDIAWIDEGVETLRQRVKQLETGVHWAEQPPSRTTHMISNVAIRSVTRAPGADADDIDGVEGLASRCRFLLYRNRNEDEQDFFIGKRNDELRRTAEGWKLARREIFLDQNVMLAKNLSVFF